MDITAAAMRAKYRVLSTQLDERSLRLCAAGDAKMFGYGGVSFVAKAAGLSRTTLYSGLAEARTEDRFEGGRIRKPGGGRKSKTEIDDSLLQDLDRLLDPATRGDPMSALRWTCKSTPKLAGELRGMGHEVSQATVWRMLDELGYSMQSNRKSREGGRHPDRNGQFEFINASVKDFLSRSSPAISVDTKKKELVGSFKNGGQEWERKGSPTEVDVYDFPNKELGKVSPYGVYDMARNEGWVSVGITHDTAEFAGESIRRWWLRMGKQVYPGAKELLITADGGGSNGVRVRLWKVVLRKLSDEMGLTIHMRHFPPGTSKWNKIEHRMFCHITENWRARPLIDHLTVVNLISHAATSKGLTIRAELDESQYETGKRVSDDEMAKLRITRCAFHGEWNYSFTP
ncbi:MAG: ISAzo13 family transposase [bacterium]